MRAYNFSAGPAAMPEEVLKQVQEELLDYQDIGVSVMELSHRSKVFDEILFSLESRARSLMGLSDEYAIIFLPGGASQQFAMVPLNFCRKAHPVNIVHTGHWTQRAMDEVKKVGELKVIASGEAYHFRSLPKLSPDLIQPEAAYLHYCSNNTIFGTQWKTFVRRGGVPTVVDMSSDFLSKPFEYSQFDMIYAGAQKNLGPAGLCIVAIKKEFAARGRRDLPEFFQYDPHIKAGSRLNTPPTFTLYMANLVLEWIQREGGLKVMGERNSAKASELYAAIDASSFYSCPIQKEDRSLMNVIIRIREGDEKLEDLFVEEAEKNRLRGLKGHRLSGGLRASLYNAVGDEAVKALVKFMKDFEKSHG